MSFYTRYTLIKNCVNPSPSLKKAGWTVSFDGTLTETYHFCSDCSENIDWDLTWAEYDKSFAVFLRNAE